MKKSACLTPIGPNSPSAFSAQDMFLEASSGCCVPVIFLPERYQCCLIEQELGRALRAFLDRRECSSATVLPAPADLENKASVLHPLALVSAEVVY